jgi:UDP-N-acetylmuramate dehydrogenase
MKNPFHNTRGIRVITGEQLSEHTSFHIGGPARYFVYVYNRKALRSVLAVIARRKIRHFVIGAGTNLLAMDGGFNGVVVSLSGTFRRISIGRERCRCGGGSMINDLVQKAAASGYGGCDFMAGIPGTMGGAVKGNAGAFGRSISEIIERVAIMDQYGVERLKTRTELGFSYRNSRIKDGDIITSVVLSLKKQARKKIMDKIHHNLKIRETKHPRGFSAGSFFKNPPGKAAGRLIEECGLKGLSVGEAEISRKHANYVVNRGQARAADVITLSKIVRRVVYEKSGVRLRQEVQLLK